MMSITEAIAPINSEAQYTLSLAALDTLLAEVGENSAHPLADLVEGLISRVTAYQDTAGHVQPAAADMELRLLMNERHVTQSALAEATGIAQAQISRLMNGKRAFTAEHARRLAGYFQVGPEVFLQLAH